MKKAQDFSPDWVSAPGDTITDILNERGILPVEFARQLGLPLDSARELLEGRASITISLARRLRDCLGASVEFWMSRDYQYRRDISRVSTAAADWLSQLPLGDMIGFGWIKPVPRPSEEVAACLRFFDVPSLSAWRETYEHLHQVVALRTSLSFDSNPAAIAAWLRQGEIEASAIDSGPWDPRNFRESLPALRSLTRWKDPARFIPELQKRCAQSGVALAVVRAPTGCRASGATRFLTRDKALLLLSFRHLSDDQFWFSFFHEAGHLLLHSDSGLILEGDDQQSDALEDEANEFAASALVPVEFQQELSQCRADARRVIKWARRLGISPGIVVGQLQHSGRLRHNQLNGLKRRYQWEMSDSISHGTS